MSEQSEEKLNKKYGLTPEFIRQQKEISNILNGEKKRRSGGSQKRKGYMGKTVKDAYVGIYADNFETYMHIQNFSMFCNIALKNASAIMAAEVHSHMMNLGPLDRPSPLLVAAFNEIHPLDKSRANLFLAKRNEVHRKMLAKIKKEKEENGDVSEAQ